MTDATSAWHEAGERFASLGAKLKVHYEQQHGEAGDQARTEIRDALHRLTGALDDAFEAIGTAARDDAVKSDVKQVGQSLVTALGATFSEVSTEVQRAFATRRDDAGSGPEDGDRPAPAAEPSASEPSASEPSASEPSATAGSSTTGPTAASSTEPGDGSGDDAGADGGRPRVEPWGTP